VTAGQDAAPALVPRTHRSGTPRAAVRPNYVGLPTLGLDAGRRNAGESLRDQVGRMASIRPRKHGPGVQNRRDGAPRGARPAFRAPAPQGVDFKGAARRSIPSPDARETAGVAAPDKKPASARACARFKFNDTSRRQRRWDD
jgi:hypothetical protein